MICPAGESGLRSVVLLFHSVIGSTRDFESRELRFESLWNSGCISKVAHGIRPGQMELERETEGSTSSMQRRPTEGCTEAR